ncbi:unnamed protein product [Rotaria magnacalcarata]|uniref:Uncharacterized protein n=2 Tax=Rotaria magnacalcarata TaxID=392030 RepID=A0A816NTM5_9BILA|nr:unnamed protein product [Rotaria magnacalcarata]
MQSWNQFQLVNPSFTMNVPNNDITLLRDVFMSLETSTIEISIIEIRPTYEYDFQNTITTTTFILIGDASGDEKTTLWASDLVLEQLLNLVGVSIDDTDTDIASVVLSYGNMLIQYSELCKEIILVMKP